MGSLEKNDTIVATTHDADTFSLESGLLKKAVTKKIKKPKKPQKLQHFLQFDTVPRSICSTSLAAEIMKDDQTELHNETTQQLVQDHDTEWSYEPLKESVILKEDQLDDDSEYYWMRSSKSRTKGGRGGDVIRSTSSHKKQRIQKDKLVRLHDEHKKLKKAETIKTNHAHQKVNIEGRLIRNGIKRFGLELYKKRLDRDGPTSKPLPMAEPRRINNTNSVYLRDDPVSVKRHELKKTNVPKEHAYLAQIIDLQHRELTPEDYELLLLLDNTVSAKTVDLWQIRSINAVPVSTVAGLLGETCSICMENYEMEQTAKMLPCEHYFHSSCIDFWLTNSSHKCPLDGSEVFPE